LLVDDAVDVNMAMSLKEYTGVITDTDSLCLMSVVEPAPMTKGHTYPSNEIAMMQITPILWPSGRAGAKRSRGPGFKTALVALKCSRTTRV
jgi:hypothetical protein